MPVFVSHSFENKAEFDNIADALEQKGIEYWQPGSLKAGSPNALTPQLGAGPDDLGQLAVLISLPTAPAAQRPS
jgi:hypothetical protein